MSLAELALALVTELRRYYKSVRYLLFNILFLQLTR